MNRPRAPRRISHAQRLAAPSEANWRQKTNNPWQGEDVAGVNAENQDHKQHDEETAPRGICQTMCPARELQDREAKRRLHRFEMLPGTEKVQRPKADPLRAVKEYSRPAAGKDSTNPANLRPPAVLLITVCYLIDDIAASPDLHPWTEVYSFVFDRLRGVKQDMIIQRVSGAECVAVLEKTVRFLIYASYRLCGEPLRLYDPCINDTHLQEYLSWLLKLYTKDTEPHPNQEEFQALALLYNLGSPPAMRHVINLPDGLRSSPSVTLAMSINRAFLERNPVRLLRLADRLSFLQACALHRHLAACRRDLLLIYSHGYSSRNSRFPLSKLGQLLSLSTTATSELCQEFGVELLQDAQVVFSKAAFTEAEQRQVTCKLYHSIVSDKQRDLTVKNIVHGCGIEFK
ncbi:SAC3 domain-containing protein 1 [Gouania willdenowi]|uniref:SAC3/GANP/THP3 conserved domain-containing protein n=1 Tax=Gouania willdenowi TaxID=441366 RepID=A0A8C5EVZ7_GOUWI|nr:SAC3 domain-containing protein 1 [Gouania willdenowi]